MRANHVRLSVEMFGLAMPEKLAEEVVKKDVKMIFDPATNELIEIVMIDKGAEARYARL